MSEDKGLRALSRKARLEDLEEALDEEVKTLNVIWSGRGSS